MMAHLIKKFRSFYKNLNDQAKPGRRKTTDFEALLQAKKANPASRTRGVSGELGISVKKFSFTLINNV